MVFQSPFLGGLLLILTAGCFSSPVSSNPIQDNQSTGKLQKVPFSLEDLRRFDLFPSGFNGSWSNNGIIYTDESTKNVIEYDVATGNRRLILDAEVKSKYPGATLHFSTDKSFVLLGYDPAAGFRHSIYSKYVAYDIRNKVFHQIANGQEIPLVKWSPIKNAVAYVQGNDIYYQEFDDPDKTVIRLTNTGEQGIIYNGIPDWVYEEEVFGTGSALWFSPNGQYLAFASFNDTDVKDAVYLYYGRPGSMDDQYVREVKIKYPKAGCTNPSVSLNLIDLTSRSGRLIDLRAPVDIVGQDHILYTVTWRDDNHLLATWTNRVQNKMQLVLYNSDGTPNYVLTDEEQEGWLIIKPIIHHEKYAILLKLQDTGLKAGRFMHATRFEYKDGKLIGELDLTPGPSEVHGFVTVDHVREKLYYLATRSGEPSQRNLYVVPIDGSGKPECISCGHITPEGNNCTYVSVSFSKSKSYYSLSCLGPDPTVVTIFDADHNQILVWEDNAIPRKKLRTRAMPHVRNIYIRANNYYSKVRLFLPNNFDQKKKYPLLIHVYAGPHSAKINDMFTVGFPTYMTTNRSVIYGLIDGRGSSNRGSKFLYEVYRQLGGPEVQDQITVVKELTDSFPWIDADRTGIWGWSYGGYATGMVLSTDKESVFKCGLSVAPVSSWIYYDSIYTERYMGLPTIEDNQRGYNESDLTRKVEGLKGKKYMLIHGTGDDNVHFQQAMALTKALEENNILFEQQFYPDEAHGLTGVYTHLYRTMDRFWEDCFHLPPH